MMIRNQDYRIQRINERIDNFVKMLPEKLRFLNVRTKAKKYIKSGNRESLQGLDRETKELIRVLETFKAVLKLKMIVNEILFDLAFENYGNASLEDFKTEQFFIAWYNLYDKVSYTDRVLIEGILFDPRYDDIEEVERDLRKIGTNHMKDKFLYIRVMKLVKLFYKELKHILS